eukprot:PhF_6_TR18962/c0_g1_i3/m.27828
MATIRLSDISKLLAELKDQRKGTQRVSRMKLWLASTIHSYSDVHTLAHLFLPQQILGDHTCSEHSVWANECPGTVGYFLSNPCVDTAEGVEVGSLDPKVLFGGFNSSVLGVWYTQHSIHKTLEYLGQNWEALYAELTLSTGKGKKQERRLVVSNNKMFNELSGNNVIVVPVDGGSTIGSDCGEPVGCVAQEIHSIMDEEGTLEGVLRRLRDIQVTAPCNNSTPRDIAGLLLRSLLLEEFETAHVHTKEFSVRFPPDTPFATSSVQAWGAFFEGMVLEVLGQHEAANTMYTTATNLDHQIAMDYFALRTPIPSDVLLFWDYRHCADDDKHGGHVLKYTKSMISLYIMHNLYATKPMWKHGVGAIPEQEVLSFRNNKVGVLPQVLPPLFQRTLSDMYRVWVDSGALPFKDRRCDRFYGYHDSVARCVLGLWHRCAQYIVGKPIIPSYTYFIEYVTGGELTPHTDREQCEFVISIQLPIDPEGEVWPIGTCTVAREAFRGDQPLPDESQHRITIL